MIDAANIVVVSHEEQNIWSACSCREDHRLCCPLSI